MSCDPDSREMLMSMCGRTGCGDCPTSWIVCLLMLAAFSSGELFKISKSRCSPELRALTFESPDPCASPLFTELTLQLKNALPDVLMTVLIYSG